MSITITYYLSLNSPWTYMGSGPFAEIARRYGARKAGVETGSRL